MGQSITVAQRTGAAVDRQQPATAQEHRAIGNTIDGFEIVGGDQDDASVAAKIAQSRTKGGRRCVVETGKGLVEQNQPRSMQQGTLECEALSHTTGESSRGVVALRKPRSFERVAHRTVNVRDAIGAGKEREILCR